MTLDEFSQTYGACSTSALGAAVWRLDGRRIAEAGARVVDLHFIMLVTRGWMSLRIDCREATVTAGCYVDSAGCHDTTEITAASADVDGYALVTTEEFLARVFKNRLPFETEYLELVRRRPVLLLDGRQAGVVAEAFGSLGHSMADRANIHASALVAVKTAALFYEISNCFMQRAAYDGRQAVTDRMTAVFMRFIELVRRNATRRRDVAFYASELCITPQYLNKIVNAVSDKTASYMINMAVTAEIKELLADPGLALKDIVRRMDFADQAVFTKFFKRQTGMTPMQYRNMKE